MSFELLLFRFEAGKPARLDAAAVDAVLARHSIDRAAGVYAQTRDGLEFELSCTIGAAPADHDELRLSMRGMSAGLLELVHELAHAAALGVVLPDDEARVLVPRADLVSELPEELGPTAVVCRSAEELATSVLPLFERWRAWSL